MKLILLTSFLPRQIEGKIILKSKGLISNANNLLQKNLIDGLFYYYPKMSIINSPNVGSYPFRYKEAFIPATYSDFPSGVRGSSISFFNFMILKKLHIYFKISRALKKSVSKDSDDHIILIYDFNFPCLISACKLAKKYSNVKVILFVPDLPGFTDTKPGLLYSSLTSLKKTLAVKLINQVSGFVLISKHIAEKIPVSSKPWIVLEGISTPLSITQAYESTENKKQKTIFYAGAVNARNGIIKLMDAFMGISDDSYSLIICGTGALIKLVEKNAKKDPRILCFGQIPHKQVLELQVKSTLLVNLRLPTDEFTRYSFPSKIMEYFSSGVPVLTYRLAGIPDEYLDHCYTLDQYSTDALRKRIISICEKNPDDLSIKSIKAKEFILNKNPINQCKKIQRLICKVLN